MHELRRDASEIVPTAGQNRFDLLRGFLRKRRGEIIAGNAMLPQQRTEPAHDRGQGVCRSLAIAPAQQPHQDDSDPADGGVQHRAQAPCCAERTAGQSVTTIFPNTCRLSRRARPCSKFSIVTSVSITGSMPAAILWRLSRMLRMEAPNEPMIRYCCWNSCIRLNVVDGPEVAPQVTRRPPRFRHRSEPLKVSAPTCSNTTSTPFLAVSLRTTPSKRSVR